MRWFTKHLRNIGIACVGMLFFLTCLALIPLSAVSAHEGTFGVATPSSSTVQATPTTDATVMALSKEQLKQEVQQLTQQAAQQQHTLDNWLWSNAATILSSFLSTLVIVVGALFGLWRWRKDQHTELEKRTEERFQAAVTGLGDDKEGARIGAAILLRTFQRPGYEQFYSQTFDLAVAHLRLPRTAHPPEDPDAPLSLTTLSQALIVVFKEVFPLAREQTRKRQILESSFLQRVIKAEIKRRGKAYEEQINPLLLDASRIQLDSAYLAGADLYQAWMPQAFLRKVNLHRANLGGAYLSEANLGGAYLSEANLSGTDLSRANLSGADLSEAFLGMGGLSKFLSIEANLRSIYISTTSRQRRTNLSGADLSGADLRQAFLQEVDLSGANLSGANLSRANFNGTSLGNARSLKDTDLRGVSGLTKEQLAACKARDAIIDGAPTTSASQSTVISFTLPLSDDVQALSSPPAQEGIPTPDSDGSNTASSQQGPES